MSVLEKLHVDLVTSIKCCTAVEWNAFEHSINRKSDAFGASRSSGEARAATAYERALVHWTILSISGNDNTKNPHGTF